MTEKMIDVIVSSKNILRAWLWAVTIAGILAVLATIQQANDLEIVFWRSRWIFIVGIFIISSLIGLWLLISPFLNRIEQKMDAFEKYSLPNWLGIFIILLGFVFVWVMRLYVFGNTLPQTAPIFWVFLWSSLLQTIGLKLTKPSIQWHLAFAIALLFQGFLYQTVGIFRIVSDDPLSIGYSEAGRFYYASLFFSESLYGTQLPLPFLHPSRYLLLSIPFLIGDLPLWMHRLWQAVLWFGLTLASSFLLVRRFKFNKQMTIYLTAWAFIYFFQGAVYYHLHICVILILVGVSAKHVWRSLFFIILASLWAGISRVNWFPVPAMLAIAIYLLEEPINDKGWKYWFTPLIWGITGIVCALVSQFFYIQISGNVDISAFGSSFTSDLIWSRLLPNETYPMGILPGIVLVSLPLWLGLYQIIRGNLNSLHLLRWLALWGMLLVLFVGGAVVSTKIGGGGDLHNMDAYLVLMSLIAMFFWANQVSPEKVAKPLWGRVSWEVIFAALLIPLCFSLPKIGFFHQYDTTIAEQDIRKLQEMISTTLQNGDQVLFITERQLITFDYVNGVALVPEYEQSELMEMAMSRNQLYLEQYYQDLKNHRFALIIAEDQKFVEQKQGAFVEEDVAWVRFVGTPLLCSYKPLITLNSNNIQVFEPRPKVVTCKDPFTK